MFLEKRSGSIKISICKVSPRFSYFPATVLFCLAAILGGKASLLKWLILSFPPLRKHLLAACGLKTGSQNF
ncbi:hypothetical protein ASPVEDRAFT_754446 [Aspergillus versicolor CBS 583.65]|uniref:Uncharacterized protein n=1 Tax=Aspergillus versicolor CBS 583.65 TaxID=1036611 RepID=A0A1L9PQH3_ASPVE|nr:uncharacterized protein ASPVEDRAFT_754446 [Aspergillus versicolor CBS 583.65]OJJ03753.1 hypothetical protein ASPVEDRAFT_754446 [Aspergillus versicolor CBS 583.65]